MAWTPASTSVTRHDVYGLSGGVLQLLGSAGPLEGAFLAPSGYDAYRVVAVAADGGAGEADTPCVYFQTSPPGVNVDFHCGRHAAMVRSPLP